MAKIPTVEPEPRRTSARAGGWLPKTPSQRRERATPARQNLPSPLGGIRPKGIRSPNRAQNFKRDAHEMYCSWLTDWSGSRTRELRVYGALRALPGYYTGTRPPLCLTAVDNRGWDSEVSRTMNADDGGIPSEQRGD